MGAYLANGLVVRMKITGKIDNKKDMILEQLRTFIDVDTYHIAEVEKEITLDIDKEFFDNNIHSCLKELSEMFGTDFFEYYNNKDNSISNSVVQEEFFNKKEFPITLEQYDNSYDMPYCKMEGEYYISIPDCDIRANHVSHSSAFYGNRFLNFLNEDLRGVDFSITIVSIWNDFWKYCCEDPSWNLYALNLMKTSYYHNPLSKNLIYYVNGL